MSINSRTRGRPDSLKGDVKKAASEATTSPVTEAVMRLGYFVRGLVYGIIGLLALQVVLGGGGALTDMQGAIAALEKTTPGEVLLYFVLAGLAGYGLWGLVRAVLDPLHKGTDAKGIAGRVGYVVSGISYMLLGLATYNLIRGAASAAHSGAQTAQIQQTAGSLLSKPWGAGVLAFGALIIMVVGLLQVYQGVHPSFELQFRAYALSSSQQKWINRMGRFGAAARGLVFTLIGIFLFLAAYHNDPSRAQGMEGVLASLLRQPYGLWLLGLVALGLIAFGIYSAMSGVWLRLRR